jgi:hypothetical protein
MCLHYHTLYHHFFRHVQELIVPIGTIIMLGLIGYKLVQSFVWPFFVSIGVIPFFGSNVLDCFHRLIFSLGTVKISLSISIGILVSLGINTVNLPLLVSSF